MLAKSLSHSESDRLILRRTKPFFLTSSLKISWMVLWPFSPCLPPTTREENKLLALEDRSDWTLRALRMASGSVRVKVLAYILLYLESKVLFNQDLRSIVGVERTRRSPRSRRNRIGG